jgi:hypothetical protein
MDSARLAVTIGRRKETPMNTLYTVIVIVFVVAVVGAVAYSLFKMSPFAKHVDHFRDDEGKRLGSSPRLD